MSFDSFDDHGGGERRAGTLRAIPVEARLDSAGAVLLATGQDVLLSLARLHVAEAPARRENDRAWRVTLEGETAEGAMLDLGAICGHLAERLLESDCVLIAHVDPRDAVRLVSLPVGTAGNALEIVAADVATILAAIFGAGTVDVALSAQPANPDPALPLLRRLRQVALARRRAAPETRTQRSPADA